MGIYFLTWAAPNDNIFVMYIVAILLVVLGVTAAEADVYRYVDESGVVCYTDFPLNKKAERILRTGKSSVQEKETPVRSSYVASPAGRDYDDIVIDKAGKYDVDPSLVHAVIKAESNGNSRAVSRKGAMGLMQLMPTTANDLEVRNPFDPEENIDGGTKYLKYLIDKFRGDLTLALAAYNAGPTRVEKVGAVPKITETKQYVKKVLSMYNGGTTHQVSPSPTQSQTQAPDYIYKVVTEDGAVLFTNSPVYKKNPRF